MTQLNPCLILIRYLSPIIHLIIYGNTVELMHELKDLNDMI